MADDETAAQALADTISEADDLNPDHVQAMGQQRFDPKTHFEALATRSC
ncbi:MULTISPECIES: hypothetical protein [Streptomyces]|nr:MULTISPECIES: hypothetical protein [Streptomyces]